MISTKNLNFIRVVEAVKTGIAAALSIYVANLLKLPQGYWAAISAIVVMQSEVGATFSASRDRLIGTAVGAILGALFLSYGEGRLLWFGLAVVVTVLICRFFGLDQSYRLACVTIAIVMLISSPHSRWLYALHRFLEVALGIVIALMVAAMPTSRSQWPGAQLHSSATNV